MSWILAVVEVAVVVVGHPYRAYPEVVEAAEVVAEAEVAAEVAAAVEEELLLPSLWYRPLQPAMVTSVTFVEYH